MAGVSYLATAFAIAINARTEWNMVVRPAIRLKQLSAVEPGELVKIAVGDQNVLCFKARQASGRNEQFFLVLLNFRNNSAMRPPLIMNIQRPHESVLSFGIDYSVVIDQRDDAVDLQYNRFYDLPGSIVLTPTDSFLRCCDWSSNYSRVYYSLTKGNI